MMNLERCTAMTYPRFGKNINQNFSDGLVMVYGTQNVAPPGELPKTERVLKGGLRFQERVVGVDRFFKGLQAVGEIVRVIRCPARREVSIHDIAVIGDEDYEIVQIQVKPDFTPWVMDLSLKKTDRRG